MQDAPQLPQDLDACHELIQQLAAQVNALDGKLDHLTVQLDEQARDLQSQASFSQEQSRTLDDLEQSREELTQENAELKLMIETLLNRLYGRRRERFVESAGQLKLDFGGDEQAVAEALAEAVLEAERTLDEVESQRKARRKKRRRGAGRDKFPEHLPRYEVVVDLPPEQTDGKKFIGYDEVERLELVRAELRVRVIKYAKYVDAASPQQGVLSPPRPEGLVEGDRFDTSVAVEIIVAKYFSHLPFYRQQDIFASCGWTPSRSTLLNVQVAAESVLRPFAEYHRDLLGPTDLIHILGCDDTPVRLIVPPELPPLDPDDPRSARIAEVLSRAQAEGRPSVKAHMWGYRAVELPINLFDFTVSRHRDGPDEVLSGFSGMLMGDCWSGFQQIELRSGARIVRAACWAHARRKVHECRTHYPRQSTVLLALIRQLYDIEDRAKLFSPAERLELRRRESTRVLAQTCLSADRYAATWTALISTGSYPRAGLPRRWVTSATTGRPCRSTRRTVVCRSTTTTSSN